MHSKWRDTWHQMVGVFHMWTHHMGGHVQVPLSYAAYHKRRWCEGKGVAACLLCDVGTRISALLSFMVKIPVY